MLVILLLHDVVLQHYIKCVMGDDSTVEVSSKNVHITIDCYIAKYCMIIRIAKYRINMLHNS